MKSTHSMRVTPEKLEANRRNARRSTGPRTAAGKAASKMNSLRHGLLAKTVLVHSQLFDECPREFKKLCADFYRTLAPEGAMETMLADEIIQASWRLRRVRVAEAGEITLSVDGGYWHRQCLGPKMLTALWGTRHDPIAEMLHSAMGNAALIAWLQEVRRQVDQAGVLSDAAIQILSVPVRACPCLSTKPPPCLWALSLPNDIFN